LKQGNWKPVGKMSLIINKVLVRRLIATQFPQWRDLPIRPVAISGWDNRTFHLGDSMLVRLPSAAEYALQIEKEHLWLPQLAPLLPLPIPEPLAIGEPINEYPWRWSVYRWLKGEPASSVSAIDLCACANQLATFLLALQKIDSTKGPLPGPHNFYRGGSLTAYSTEVQQAITILKDKVDTKIAKDIWETALATSWLNSPVWVHGDVNAGNLLVQARHLSAVIDFGMLGIGDPACDLTITWTFFTGKSREQFRKLLVLDTETWARGRAWALWKALIIAARLTQAKPIETIQSWQVIREVLTEHERNS